MVTDRLPWYRPAVFAQTPIPAMFTGMLRWYVGRTFYYWTSMARITFNSRKRI